MAAPIDLWNMEGGIFRGMCDRSGIRVEDIKSARKLMGLLDAGATAEDDDEQELDIGVGSSKKGRAVNVK